MVFLVESKPKPTRYGQIMEPDEFILLKSFPDESSAALLAARLESEGIATRIRKDDCGGAYPALQMSTGVKLFVSSADLETARNILKAVEGTSPELRVAPQLVRSSEATRVFDGQAPGLVREELTEAPSVRFEYLKPRIFLYIILAPLLAALFADKIDNLFLACLLFVGMVGTAFIHFRNEFRSIEEGILDRESRLTKVLKSSNVPMVRCYRSPKVEIRFGGVEGRGVFAKEKISKNEIVAIKAGHIVSCQELAAITETVGDYALQISDDYYLTPIRDEEVEAMTIFINHSCDPNVGFAGQITYVAMRDIEAREELCHDYAMERSDSYFLYCKCGSQICRNHISGDDWKNPELQRKYGKYFSSYILSKINKGI